MVLLREPSCQGEHDISLALSGTFPGLAIMLSEADLSLD
jgi:hypothetical protein